MRTCLVCGSEHVLGCCAALDHPPMPAVRQPWPFPRKDSHFEPVRPAGPDYLPAQPHPDDLAIDAFALVLKAKMAASRAKGRQGWDDPGQCTVEDLSIGLRVHVGKGDPVDVALYCMMLAARGAGIVGVRPPAGTPAALFALHEEIDRQIAADRLREKEQAKRDRRAEARAGSGRRSVDKA